MKKLFGLLTIPTLVFAYAGLGIRADLPAAAKPTAARAVGAILPSPRAKGEDVLDNILGISPLPRHRRQTSSAPMTAAAPTG